MAPAPAPAAAAPSCGCSSCGCDSAPAVVEKSGGKAIKAAHKAEKSIKHAIEKLEKK